MQSQSSSAWNCSRIIRSRKGFDQDELWIEWRRSAGSHQALGHLHTGGPEVLHSVTEIVGGPDDHLLLQDACSKGQPVVAGNHSPSRGLQSQQRLLQLLGGFGLRCGWPCEGVGSQVLLPAAIVPGWDREVVELFRCSWVLVAEGGERDLNQPEPLHLVHVRSAPARVAEAGCEGRVFPRVVVVWAHHLAMLASQFLQRIWTSRSADSQVLLIRTKAELQLSNPNNISMIPLRWPSQTYPT